MKFQLPDFLGKHKTVETVRRSVVARGWKQQIGRAQGIFQATELFLMIFQWLDACHCTLVQPIECTTPRMNHSVNYGLWVTLMCQCRLVNGNKCVILV